MVKHTSSLLSLNLLGTSSLLSLNSLGTSSWWYLSEWNETSRLLLVPASPSRDLVIDAPSRSSYRWPFGSLQVTPITIGICRVHDVPCGSVNMIGKRGIAAVNSEMIGLIALPLHSKAEFVAISVIQ